MTAPLRRAHFAMWLALGALMIAVFASGFMARRESAPRNPGFRWEQMQ